MAEGRSDGGRQMVGTADGYAAGFGDFTVACKCVPTLQFRSLGERLAPEVGARRSGSRPLRGRYYLGIPVSNGRGSLSGELARAVGQVRTGTSPGQDAPDRIRPVCRREPET